MFIFRFILKFLAIVFIVAFVVLNRQETTLYISPLSEPLTLPMWIMGLVLFSIGFTVGALLLWLNTLSVKRDLKQARKKLDQAEHDLVETSENLQDKQIKEIENSNV